MTGCHPRGAGLGSDQCTVLGEDVGLEERLHQVQDAFVSDAISHATHRDCVVDLIEACRDVRFQNPLVGAGGEVVDLGDRILGSAFRAETVTARLEVRFENWLQHQLQRGLHDPVLDGWDAEAAAFAVRFRDHPFPHRDRLESLSFEVIS